MSYADYFYLTAYPVYDGYRIEHDPTLTAYASLTTSSSSPENTIPSGIGLVVLVGIAIVVIAGVVVLRKKRQ